MTETANSLAVVIDANILIAICSKEEKTFEKAQAAFNRYALQGAEFFAPNVMIAEVLFCFMPKGRQGDFDQGGTQNGGRVFSEIFNHNFTSAEWRGIFS